MNLENILDFVNVWRTANGITGNVVLTEAQQKQFALDLQGKVNEFSVHPERVNWGKYDANAPMTWSADARVIPYSADVGKLPAWRVAESISRDGKGKTFFISDTPAGQLLNSTEFQDAVRDTIGGADSVAGKTLQKRLFYGTWLENDTRTPYGISDVPALNDAVSKRMMAEAAFGDVKTLTATALNDGVFVQTELPALLENSKVTAINGIKKEIYLEILNKTGSYVEVNKAVAASSDALEKSLRVSFNDGKITIDTKEFFKGTGYEGVEIPPDTPNTRSMSFDMEQIKTIEHTNKIREGFSNISIAEAKLKLIHGASWGLGASGVVLMAKDVIDFLNEAKAADNAGDPNRAAEIILRRSTEIGAGFIAGEAVGVGVAAYVATLELVGGAAIVAGLALTLSAAFIAGAGTVIAVKYLMDEVRGEMPSVSYSGDLTTTNYGGGIETTVDRSVNGHGVDLKWTMPSERGWISGERNSATGDQTTYLWSSERPGEGQIIETTHTSYDHANLQFKIETNWVDKSTGNEIDLIEHKPASDITGPAIDTWRQITSPDGSARVEADSPTRMSSTNFDADGVKIQNQWLSKVDGSHGSYIFDKVNGISTENKFNQGDVLVYQLKKNNIDNSSRLYEADPNNGSYKVTETHSDKSIDRVQKDAFGNLITDKFSSNGENILHEEINRDNSYYKKEINPVDGSSTTLFVNSEGEKNLKLDDNNGNWSNINYDSSGNAVDGVWARNDDSYGDFEVINGTRIEHINDGAGYDQKITTTPDKNKNIVWNDANKDTSGEINQRSDGTYTSTTVMPDRSKQFTVKDQNGVITTDYVTNWGYKNAKSWTSPDGTKGSEFYDGKKTTQQISKPDGSVQTTYTDGEGNGQTKISNKEGTITQLISIYKDNTYRVEITNSVTKKREIFHRNANGSYMKSVSDGKDDTYSYKFYDAKNNMTRSETRGANGAVTYVKIENGTRTEWSGKDLDENGDLDKGVVRKTITNPDGTITSMGDDRNGRRDEITYGADGVGIVGTTFIEYKPDGSGVIYRTDKDGRVTRESVDAGTIKLYQKKIDTKSEYSKETEQNGVTRTEYRKPDGTMGGSYNDGVNKIETTYGVDGIGIISNRVTERNPDGSGVEYYTGPDGRTERKEFGPGEIPALKQKKDPKGEPTPPEKPKELPNNDFPKNDNPDDHYDDDQEDPYPEPEPDPNPEPDPTPDPIPTPNPTPNPGPNPGPRPYPPPPPPPPPPAPRRDPLAFDLNRDGVVETVSKDNGVNFDLDNNGFAERTSWVGSNDALLVFDRNLNGKIDGGGELFGTETLLKTGKFASNGFEALAEFDFNKDGVININDTVFSELRIWQDSNVNGIAEEGELKTLASIGIKQVNLAYQNNLWTDTNDVQHRENATYVLEDGTSAVTNTLWFDIDKRQTIPVEELIGEGIVVSEAIKKLPNVVGFGNTHSLHHAMALDNTGQLQAKVEAFVAENDPAKRQLLVTEILFLWTKQTGVDPLSRGGVVDARKVGVLESFWGQATLDRDPTGSYGASVQQAYDQLERSTYSQLMVNSHFASLIKRATFTKIDGKWVGDFRDAAVHFAYAFKNADSFAVERLLEYMSVVSGLNPYDTSLSNQLRADILSVAELFEPDVREKLVGVLFIHADVMVGTADDDILRGYQGNDSISGGSGDDDLSGDDGNDLIQGGDGADLIDGGVGNDQLFGDIGNDLINGRDGDDVIRGGIGSDVVLGDAGNDTIFGQQGDDFVGGGEGSDYIVGDVGNDRLFGDAGKDEIIGGDGADYIDGGVGDDQLDGGFGNDTVIGGPNDDYLAGGDGDDVLDGGAGNDYLRGGFGNDTYLWGIGSGKDIITNEEMTIGRKNVLKIGEGIHPSDLWVKNESTTQSVILGVKHREDTFTIFGGFDLLNTAGVIQEFIFADGTVWTHADLKTMSLIGTENDEEIFGFESDDVLRGNGGDDTLFAGVGRDTLDGGTGNDQMSGGWGSDTYIFGRVSGNDVIHESNDLDHRDLNVIQFEPGISLSDISFDMVENGSTVDDLLIKIRDTSSSVVVKNFFREYKLSNGERSIGISQLVFSDGTSITRDEIRQSLIQRQITAGNDVIHGFEGSDVLEGGAGDDTIEGYLGDDVYKFGRSSGNDTFFELYYDLFKSQNIILLDNDVKPEDVQLKRDTLQEEDVLLSISGSSNTLRLQRHLGHFYLGKIQFSDGTSWDYNEVFRRVNLGTSAVDLIVGTSADETFDGLGGDDRIEGGGGGDTYLFDRNSGNDTILDRGDSLVLNNSDKVQLGVGILPSDVKLRRQSSMSPNDILLSISGSASTLTIQSGLTQNYDGSFNYAIETIRFADGTEWNWSAIKQKVSQGTNTDDIINGFIDSDDELDGAGGNDRMEGYDGSDTYIFGRNYGNDFIEDYDQAGIGRSNDLDVVKLAAGVLPEDVLVSRDSNESLILTIQGTADKLTIYRYFDKPVWANGASPFQIEKIQFENGIVWDYSAVLAAFMRGTNGDDSIYGKETDDTINGFGGNDLVFGAGGNDRLYGGDGNDTVVGGDGDDIVDGNSGNDELRGGDGFDQYIFGRQSGNDLINDGDNQSVIRRDQIVLDSDIAPADISLSRDGSGSNVGLVISIAGSSSSLKIYPYFYGTELNPSMRQEILFADGTIWNAEQIKDLSTPVANRAPIVSEPIADQAAKQNILFNFAIPDAAFKDLDTTDVLTYSASLSNGSALPSWLKFNASTKTFSGTPTVLSTVGVKVTVRDKEGLTVSDAFNIVVGSSNQVLNGTNGTDNLIGNIGNDTLTGFAGEDALFGGRGNDIYAFNRGDGQDTIDNLDLLTATDTLRFATGVIDTDVLAFKSGNHLAFKLKNSTDQVVIANYYAANTTINGQAADYKIDKVEFSNAVSWNQSMIQTMVDRATNNKAPTLGTAVPNQNIKVDVAYSFTVPVNTIVDADVGDTVTYSLKMQDGSALPTWLSFNAATRIISGTPTLSNLGSISLTLWGTDNYGTALGQNLSMTVNPANRAPVVAVNVPDQMASQGAAFNYTIPINSFSDPDIGDVLTYSATLVDGTALPSWLILNATTGAFSGTPISVGTLSIKVTAKDSGNLNASDVFDLTVNVSNLNLTGTTGADTLTGGVGNDSLSGLAGNDKLTGNAGNDSLDGGAGSDTLIGGLGDDTYIVDATTDVVTENVNEGIDTVKSSVTLTLANNVDNLTLIGTTAINGTGNALNNVVTGNRAINTLNGGVGADTLAGAAGNDIYMVDNINDVIVENANEGTDQVNSSVSFTLSANVENLTLTGSASINATGNAAVNTLTGNAGNNVLDGGAGNDSMVGGKGNDTYVVDTSGDIVIEAESAGTDLVQSSVSYTLGTNLENLTLTGTANINATGNTAANVLFGNSGNNVLDGGAGADAMSGGAGNDIYVRDNTGDVITENASEGIDQVKSSLTYTLIANLESLLLTGTTAINGTGNALDNLLIGNSGKNILNGGVGNDILQGVAGDDTLTDTTGNNIFDGGAGIDVITAGIGNDFIVGGLGNDTITTNTGVDMVAFNRGDGMDTLVASTGKDNTLSLGKGIKYADLLFKKSGNDLILVTGTSEQLTMKDWYTNVNNRSIANLQIVIEGTTDYNAASTNKLNNKKIEQFNFDGLVTKFDQARAANPSLTSWALSSSLLEFYLNSSDTAAIGGDLAYQYAKSGNLSAFSMAPAQALLSSAQYGNSAQALQSTTSLQDASVRLM